MAILVEKGLQSCKSMKNLKVCNQNICALVEEGKAQGLMHKVLLDFSAMYICILHSA